MTNIGEQSKRNVHTGHRQRLLEQIMKSGLENMTEVQVLEFVLTLTIPLKDTNETAHHLINEFGSFKNVLDAQYEDLMKVKGIGAKTAKVLSILPEIFFYYRKQDATKNNCKLSNLSASVVYLEKLLSSKPSEELFLVMLNTQDEVLKVEKISKGSKSKVEFSNEDIVFLVLKHKPAYLMLAHNHPGGCPTPSREDILSTTKIIELLYPLNYLLIDHIIIGHNSFFSFNKEKIISEIYNKIRKQYTTSVSNGIFEKIVNSSNQNSWI